MQPTDEHELERRTRGRAGRCNRSPHLCPRWLGAVAFCLQLGCGFSVCPGVTSRFSCPAGWERYLVSSTASWFLVCPVGGFARPLRSRRLRDRPDSACRRGAPRRRREPAARSPHAGQRVGDPARSGGMASPPSGRSEPRPPGTRWDCPRRLALPVRINFRSLLPHFGRGAFPPPVPRVANLSAARGYHAAGSGVRYRWREEPCLVATSEHRGASRRARQAWSRAEECAAAGRGGDQGRTASHPRHRYKGRHAVTK